MPVELGIRLRPVERRHRMPAPVQHRPRDVMVAEMPRDQDDAAPLGLRLQDGFQRAPHRRMGDARLELLRRIKLGQGPAQVVRHPCRDAGRFGLGQLGPDQSEVAPDAALPARQRRHDPAQDPAAQRDTPLVGQGAQQPDHGPGKEVLPALRDLRLPVLRLGHVKGPRCPAARHKARPGRSQARRPKWRGPASARRRRSTRTSHRPCRDSQRAPAPRPGPGHRPG